MRALILGVLLIAGFVVYWKCIVEPEMEWQEKYERSYEKQNAPDDHPRPAPVPQEGGAGGKAVERKCLPGETAWHGYGYTACVRFVAP